MKGSNGKKEPSPEKIRTHITPKGQPFGVELRELWRYRELVVLFARKSLKVTYTQTVLGPLWLVLSPLLSSFVYLILFGHIAKLGTEGVPELLFYLCGTATWGFFSSCFTGNAHIFTANAALFGKIYFPRLAVPLSSLLTAAVRLLIQLLPTFALMIYYAAKGAICPDGWFCLLLPLVFVQMALLGLGCGLVVSSLTARYRDLGALVPVLTQLWMYATPVVYPLSVLPAGPIRRAVLLNPVTVCMELVRRALLGVGTPQLRYAAASLGITAVILFVGLALFHRVERTFLDTV